MDNRLDFIINILGNAKNDLEAIRKQTEDTRSAFDKLGGKMLSLNAIMDAAGRVFNVFLTNREI